MEKNVFEKAYSDLLNDEHFDTVEQILRQPNIFEILKVSQYEIRHSNFLAWLLEPTGTHGLGNYFLFKFLKDAFLKSQSTEVSIADAATLAKSHVTVYREWNNIDILLEFENLILVIENKIWSGEHDEQLKIYKETVEKNFRRHRHFFVFLTPYGQKATMPETYISYSYVQIIAILEMMVRVNSTSLNQSSKIYIQDYISSLKMHIMGTSEANELAKKIYYSHKQLFDFIIANRPDPILEIQEAIMKRIVSAGGVLSSCGGGFIRFLSKKLNELIPRDCGPRGWANKEAFLFEIYLRYEPNRLRIYCTLPPNPCPSKPLLKTKLDEAFSPMPDREGWISYFDDQITYDPVEVASKGKESIELFIDKIWPSLEKMIATAEVALIPLFTQPSN